MTFENNCPINEMSSDGRMFGRCWFYLGPNKTCPRHGDVSKAVEKYTATGKLTLENEHRGVENGRRTVSSTNL